jgi:hypothetical protein
VSDGEVVPSILEYLLRNDELMFGEELDAGGTEAGVVAWGFREHVGFFEVGLDALDDTELRDAMAGGDGLRFGGEIGEDDFELAAIAGVDDAGEGCDAAEGEAGAVFDEGAVGGRELEGKTGTNGKGAASLSGGCEDGRLGGEEVCGEIAVGAGVSVAGKLSGREKTLDEDGGIGHGS